MKRWNLFDDLILPLAFAIMRSCWVWLWIEVPYHGLTQNTAPLLPLPLMIGTVLASTLLTRTLLRSQERLGRARLIVALAGLLAMLLVSWWALLRADYMLWDIRWIGALGRQLTHLDESLPILLVVLMVTAFLWWRGIQDGLSTLYNENAWRAFGGGFLAMAFPLIAAAVAKLALPAGTLNMVLLFFAAGMIALAVTGLQQANMRLESGQGRLGVRRYWIVSVVSIVGGLLALGLLVSVLIAPETVAQALRWTSVLTDLLGRILYLLALAISYVIFFFLEPLIRWLRQLFYAEGQAEPRELPDFQKQFEELAKGNTPTPIHIWGGFRWIGLGALVVLIALAFAWALRRFWSGEKEDVQETRETILSRALLQEQLSSLWQSLMRRLRRAAAPLLNPFFPLEGEAPTRQMVRAVYQALLRAFAAGGWPRARGQTPVEYQRALEAVFSNGRTALDVITARYVHARYAPEPPTPEEAEEARQAWTWLQSSLDKEDGADEDHAHE